MNKDVRIIISAFGVHMGGGLVLLEALVREIGHYKNTLLIDERLKGKEIFNNYNSQSNIIFIKRNFYSRFIGLHKYISKEDKDAVLLCFNGLPPIFKRPVKVISFIQSPHFIGEQVGVKYPFLTRMRFVIEYMWLYFGIKNCDEVWVQSNAIKRGVLRKFSSVSIRVMSLVDDSLYINNNILADLNMDDIEKYHDYRFFYPADAVAHKNHKNLLITWYELSKKGLYPKLVLTLHEHEFDLIKSELKIMDYDFSNVINLGRISREHVLLELKNSSALIFPSLAETFGLPLLEARIAGIPIIASELDYVREICDPDESFNPRSYFSILDAVLRFLNVPKTSLADLCDAKNFIDKLLVLEPKK